MKRQARRRRCISAPPERELERKLKTQPGRPDAKADVGSDESMDASDPPSATQPGETDEPAPSSGFPENRVTDASQKRRVRCNEFNNPQFSPAGQFLA